jgi:hypothetical protein
MYKHWMRSQRMEPDDILQDVALMLKGTPSQFYHERLAFQKVNIREGLTQYLGDEMMVAHNITIWCPRKGYCHFLSNSSNTPHSR